jgi:hypothetical protein
MFLNEMPQVRRAGSMLRLGLYSFCVVSFLNYVVPVLLGVMGPWVFVLSWALSAAVVWYVVRALGRLTPDPRGYLRRFGFAPAVVLVLVALFYFFKLIPPVPLSMQYAGIFRAVEREGDRYKLTYQKPPWYKPWVRDNRHFKARPGDNIYCFTRVFAPRRFAHQIYIRWFSQNASGKWIARDRIPLVVSGGRGEGFRGLAMKSNYEPGNWRVDIETQDGRALGGVRFYVEPDDSTEQREYISRLM